MHGSNELQLLMCVFRRAGNLACQHILQVVHT